MLWQQRKKTWSREGFYTDGQTLQPRGQGMWCRRGNREKAEGSDPISAPAKLPKWTDSLADDSVLASFLEMVFSALRPTNMRIASPRAPWPQRTYRVYVFFWGNGHVRCSRSLRHPPPPPPLQEGFQSQDLSNHKLSLGLDKPWAMNILSFTCSRIHAFEYLSIALLYPLV